MRMLAATAPSPDRRALPNRPSRPRPRSRLATRLRSGWLACCAILCAGTAAADCDPEFRQVNQDGFGIGNNDYAWSMATFGEHLYVGTYSRTGSAQIWRYNGQYWMPVVGGGLTSPANRGVRNLAVFNGALYAGTSNGYTGGEIWRSTDGLTWEPLMQGGFGNVDNYSMRGMAVFQSHLYVGVLSTGQSPGEIWRTADGITFEPVIEDGFGVPQNQGVGTMEVFDNQLYVGTVNKEQGVQIWRSADGVNFEPSVGPGALTPSGFGNTFNKSVLDLHAFDGQLYVGLMNVYGFEVYRTANGIVYERVIEDGLGDAGNAYAWRFETFEGAIWMGVFSLVNYVYDAKGASLWRSFDGENWETMVGLNGTYLTYGFGDVHNWGIRSFAVYDDKLYIGTANCFHERCQPDAMGTEIWEWPGEACP